MGKFGNTCEHGFISAMYYDGVWVPMPPPNECSAVGVNIHFSLGHEHCAGLCGA